MDLHYKQEVSVGLLVIASTAVFAAGMAWLSGKSIGPSSAVTVPVRFSAVLGLKAADPVLTSGVRVGRVDRVVLEDVGRVVVYISVDKESRPHADASASVAALDFLGSKYVAYSPGKAVPLLAKDQVITGSAESGLAEGATNLSLRASEVLTAAQGFLSQRTADDLHMTMVSATRAMDVLTELGNGPQLVQASETLRSLRLVAIRLDSILGNPAIRKSLDQMDELTTSLHEMAQGLAATSQSLSAILKKLDNGEGSAGKLVNDTALYHDLRETLKSTKQLLDDVKANPGRYIKVKVF